MRVVRIGTYQLPADAIGDTARDRKRGEVERVLAGLTELGQAEVDLACLGETCTISHVQASSDDRTIYEDALAGPTVREAAKLASQYHMNVALPIAAFWNAAVRNLVVFLNRDGNIVGVYAKVHPTRSEQERGIVAGDDFPVFSLDFGIVGALICHDLSFVESARVLALRGAEILVWPTWWSGWGEELCEAVIKSRAIDNGCWLVRAGYGYPSSRAWRPGMQLGQSGVIGPDGVTLSSCGRGIGLAVATIDLDAERIAHSFTWGDEAPFRQDMLADRRPDAYTALVDSAFVPPARKAPQPAG